MNSCSGTLRDNLRKKNVYTTSKLITVVTFIIIKTNVSYRIYICDYDVSSYGILHV